MQKQPNPEILELVESLTNFRFVRELGAGAFGTAILVHDQNENRSKVLKIPMGENTTEALRAEGAHMVKLSNLLDRNIIRLYQFGHTYVVSEGRREKRYYLLMEYGGKCLRTLVGSPQVTHDKMGNPSFKGSGKKLSIKRALEISIDICRGLKAAHGFKDPETRILHRDIKPENILIDEEDGTARIVDFGIARVMERTEGFASGAGTLLYMDPECFEHRANFTSDLYSLGIVMYEILTGRLPFRNFNERFSDLEESPADLESSVPPALSDAIMKTLRRDPTQRIQSADELLEILFRVRASINPFPEKFRDIEPIGESRYSARDEKSGKKVVISLCESTLNEAEVDREKQAASKMARIKSGTPNEIFRNHQIIGLVTRYRRMQSLRDRFESNPDKTTNEFERQEQFCDAVAKTAALIHEANTIHHLFHGHLSPDLIVFNQQGDIEVQQFAFAPLLRSRVVTEADDAPDLFKDFTPYLSPQLVDGRNSMIGPTDEVYSLGVILYHGLTGKFPSQSRGPLEPGKENPTVSKRLDRIVSQCLQRDPYRRFPHPGAVWEELAKCRWPHDILESVGENALELFEEGRKIDAYDEVNHALESYPGNAYLHFIKGKLYRLDDAFEWAVKELRPAADIEFRSAEIKAELATALFGLGDLPEAMDVLREAIQLERDPEITRHLEEVESEWKQKIKMQ